MNRQSKTHCYSEASSLVWMC